MELKDLITGAQQAMDQGDYRLVIAASNHALVGYDGCLSAHRMLGEAHLERGDQQAALTHFERTLAIDPLNIVAYLGLGVAAEETKRYADAYTHYLHAWETNPALDQVRDEMVRLRGLLKMDERLHPTRAALAGIHTRSGQFRRAESEWRAILAGDPESRRARTALAELLWRQGDDVGASAAARETLRVSPENGRALAILADIERRQNGAYADEFAQRYGAVDPTGELLDTLTGIRSDSTLQSLLPDSILIDEFNFNEHRSRNTGSLARKGITASLSASQMAAPDLWDTLVQDFTNEVPTRVGATLARAGQTENLATERDIEMPGATAKSSGRSDHHDAFLAAISEPHPEEVEEHPDQTDGELDLQAPEADPISATEIDSVDGQPVLEFGAAAENTFDFDLVPFSIDQITGEVAPVHEIDEGAISASFGFADAFLDNEPDAAAAPDPPVTIQSEIAPLGQVEAPAADELPVAPKPYVDPFVTADGRIDLTAGWDSLDRELAAATPGAESGAGFDALVAELGVDGIVPFDAVVENQDDDAWAPFSETDFDARRSQEDAAPPDVIPETLPDATGDALEYADLEAFDVTSYVEPPAAPALAQDVVSGIPAQEPSGYTELLRNMDEDPLPESDNLSDPAPYTGPDATGDPLAFDQLIEVTSRDGTGPLPEAAETNLVAELDFTGTDLEAAMPPLNAAPVSDDLDGIAPFDVNVFQEEDDTPFDFAADQPVAKVPEIVEVFHTDPDLGAVAPFAFEDRPVEPTEGSAVDFSELDAVAESMVATDQPWSEPLSAELSEEPVADPAAVAGEPDLIEEAGLTAGHPAEDVVAESVSDQAEAEDLAAAMSDEVVAEPDAETVPDEAQPVAAVLEHPAVNGRDGLIPFTPTRVRWPQFVAQTSELIDRSSQTETVFARIATQKRALVEMGVVTGGKRLVPVPVPAAAAPPPVAEDRHEQRVAVEPDQAQEELNEQIRSDLMAMRVRLIEEEGSARDIADMLEQAVGNGLDTPLALRVLGEAYLKLGMVERAAAQFRQAMQSRRRSA